MPAIPSGVGTGGVTGPGPLPQAETPKPLRSPGEGVEQGGPEPLPDHLKGESADRPRNAAPAVSEQINRFVESFVQRQFMEQLQKSKEEMESLMNRKSEDDDDDDDDFD
jgi:hypothetical protein